MKALIEFLTQWYPVLITLVLPFVVNLLARVRWSGAAKRWLAFALSAVVGVWAMAASGLGWSPETLGALVLAAFGGTTLAYSLLKEIGFTNRWLEALLNIGSG